MNHSWMSAIIRKENSVEKMQVFCPWSSLRMSACTVPRTVASTRARTAAASCSLRSLPFSERTVVIPWSMAVLRKNARIAGAGPLIVIDTEVAGAIRSKPSYSAFMSSSVATETPEVPTFPYTSGLCPGSLP